MSLAIAIGLASRWKGGNNLSQRSTCGTKRLHSFLATAWTADTCFVLESSATGGCACTIPSLQRVKADLETQELKQQQRVCACTIPSLQRVKADLETQELKQQQQNCADLRTTCRTVRMRSTARAWDRPAQGARARAQPNFGHQPDGELTMASFQPAAEFWPPAAFWPPPARWRINNGLLSTSGKRAFTARMTAVITQMWRAFLFLT